jgi:hypothetical protein
VFAIGNGTGLLSLSPVKSYPVLEDAGCVHRVTVVMGEGTVSGTSAARCMK